MLVHLKFRSTPAMNFPHVWPDHVFLDESFRTADKKAFPFHALSRRIGGELRPSAFKLFLRPLVHLFHVVSKL